MRLLTSVVLGAALILLAPTASMADLTPYDQDFELLLESSLDQPEQTSLANDGWKGFVNVFGPGFCCFWYNYGPFPAPNGGFGGPAISAVVAGEGGPDQADQQLVVFSDYNNGNHGDGSGAIIETNVFQEQVVGAADVGTTWNFEFDAKRGNIEGASAAAAFFKTLDPAAGFALTNFIQFDTTAISTEWGTYSLSIFIDPSLEGQILQFGFINFASNAEGSGIFYDNINFDLAPLSVAMDIKPGSCPNPFNTKSRGVLPVALLGTIDFDVTAIDVSTLALEGVAPIRSGYEDVATPFGADLCGCNAAGSDGFMDLTLKFKTQDVVAAVGSTTGDRVLTLTGLLLDGTPFVAEDCILFVGGGRAANRPEREQLLQRLQRGTGSGPVDLQEGSAQNE